MYNSLSGAGACDAGQDPAGRLYRCVYIPVPYFTNGSWGGYPPFGTDCTIFTEMNTPMASPRERRSVTRRAGFTVYEVLIAMVVSAIVLTMVSPSLQKTRGQAQLRSGKNAIASYLSTARGTAIARGRSAGLWRHGDTIWVKADTAGTGTFVTLYGPTSLYQHYAVNVTSAVDSIVYSSRGRATTLSAGGTKFYITRDGNSDSLCVSRIGQVGRKGC